MATEMVEAQKKMDKTLLLFIKFKLFNPFDYLEVSNYFIDIELIDGNFQKRIIENLKLRITLNSQYISFMKICI